MSRNFLNTSHQTIGWFADHSDNQRMELRPPFQRRPVWLDHEKSFLVDSILRGYPVPEIYIYTILSADSSSEVIGVVDGQQRLRACLEFMTDKYVVSFDVEKLRPLYTLEDTPWYGKRYSELTSEERETFRRYKFIVRELEDVSDSEVRHMFHRLNQSNVTLNAQELRYSMYTGGLLNAAESIAKMKEWDSLGVFTVMQRRRMLDSEFISELIIGVLHWPQNKKDNLDHYYRLYANDFPFADTIESIFRDILTVLITVFPKPRMNGTRWCKKSDFYTLFLLLARGQLRVDKDSGSQTEELGQKLTKFGALVDSDAYEEDTGSVGTYRRAVSRAATDRARRVRREQALIAFLLGNSVLPEEESDYPGEDYEPSEDEIEHYGNYATDFGSEYQDTDSEYDDE